MSLEVAFEAVEGGCLSKFIR